MTKKSVFLFILPLSLLLSTSTTFASIPKEAPNLSVLRREGREIERYLVKAKQRMSEVGFVASRLSLVRGALTGKPHPKQLRANADAVLKQLSLPWTLRRR